MLRRVQVGLLTSGGERVLHEMGGDQCEQCRRTVPALGMDEVHGLAERRGEWPQVAPVVELVVSVVHLMSLSRRPQYSR